MSKTRKLILVILCFALIAGALTVMFIRGVDRAIVSSAGGHDSEAVFSGGISRYPETRGYAWALYLLGVAVTGGLVFLVWKSGWREEKLFLAMIIPLGLIYIFMMVPLAIPDEQVHYQSAYQLSNIFRFQWSGRGTCLAEHFDYTGLGGHYNLSSGVARVMRELFAPAAGEEVPLPFHYNLDYPVMYLPQALGLALGRLLGSNLVRLFIIGRLFNLLFYALCFYWAIRLTPKYKTLVMMIGLMPMAVQQAASFSYDGFIIGLSLLLFALIFRTSKQKGRITFREFIPICLTGLVLIPAKPVYYPLLLLLLLIPKERFGDWKRKLLWLAGCWAVVLLVVFLFQLSGISAVANSGHTETNWQGGENYTFSYMLANPGETAHVFVTTIRARWLDLLYESIGHSLAGMTITLQTAYPKAYLALLVLCVLRQCGDREKIGAAPKALMLVASAFSILLFMVTMFLSWTTRGQEVIQGLQGRYFIPFLPLGLICLDNDTIMLHRNTDRFVLTGALVLQAATIMGVLIRTLMI